MFSLALIVCLAGVVFGQSADQYWHERYHGILSMAAYGDYETLCPKTFTTASLRKSFPNSNATPWKIIEKWGPTKSGLSGFSVQIPEMDKVVQVFRGNERWSLLDQRSVDINTVLYIPECKGCKAHAGALKAYGEARAATNNWKLTAEAVKKTGYQWSVTGHGFGGMVAQVNALDLGWAGKLRWSHNHGAPRVFNPAAAKLYNKLFQGEAGQRVVSGGDSAVRAIPESADFTFTLQGVHIYGTNTTKGPFYGHMNWKLCPYNPRDPECAGGTNYPDHEFYYTRIGTCGASNQNPATLTTGAAKTTQKRELETESSNARARGHGRNLANRI